MTNRGQALYPTSHSEGFQISSIVVLSTLRVKCGVKRQENESLHVFSVFDKAKIKDNSEVLTEATKLGSDLAEALLR